MQSCIGCIFLYCAFSNVSSNGSSEWMHSHIGYTLVRFLSAVHYQMCPQMVCINGCIVALAAFVWLFSTVSFQMCPQIACMSRGIIALATFVRFYSSLVILWKCDCVVENYLEYIYIEQSVSIKVSYRAQRVSENGICSTLRHPFWIISISPPPPACPCPGIPIRT